MNNELLTQLLEVTSVGVAGMQLKQPLTIPRPDHVRRNNKAAESGVEHVPDNPYKRGIAVLAATARQVGR